MHGAISKAAGHAAPFHFAANAPIHRAAQAAPCSHNRGACPESAVGESAVGVFQESTVPRLEIDDAQVTATRAKGCATYVEEAELARR